MANQRRAVAASLLPAALPLALRAAGAGDVALFVASAAALLPLAWAIGTLTEALAQHAGQAAAALLNATLGNAPELLIAIVGIAHGVPHVVEQSLAGSVSANLLLVLGLALLVRRGGRVDMRSAITGLRLTAVAAAALAVPAAASGSDAVSTLLSAAVALGLGGAYVVHVRRRIGEPPAGRPVAHAESPWSPRGALAFLSLALVISLAVAETLVGSVTAFAAQAGVSGFFVAAVIVALVGNAVEHSGALLLARRGRIDLAAEIAIASGSQVAALLLPIAVLLALAAGAGSLTLGPAELAAVGAPAAAAAIVVARGSGRAGAAVLVGAYAAFAVVAACTS